MEQRTVCHQIVSLSENISMANEICAMLGNKTGKISRYGYINTLERISTFDVVSFIDFLKYLVELKPTNN